MLADWHLPHFSERWTTAAEAQRDAVELIDCGVLGAVEAQGVLAT
ncbi:hypothetical protein QU487_11070 [Crenobacter sp. SG2305]|nr:hypothetical protein [Crenobacter sp. SG2305]MDN0083289.1 hypothetical protein [Crenobacter sp. SG2305]